MRFSYVHRGLLCFAAIASTSWSFAGVQGQTDSPYCAKSESLAETFGQQVTSTCVEYRAACASTVCEDCLDGGDSASTNCYDDCVYTSGPYSMVRSFTGSYGVSSAFDVSVPLTRAGYSHIFTAGAEGYFNYNFEAVIVDNGALLLARGSTCHFTFNGVACGCQQVSCDDEQQIYANQLDCTAIEQGAFIDGCLAAVPTGPMSLLETLYWLPQLACSGTSLDSSGGATTPPDDNEEAGTGTGSAPAGTGGSNNNAAMQPSSTGMSESSTWKDPSRWRLLVTALLASLL